MKSVAGTIAGPEATRVNWKQSRQQVVEGVEQVYDAIKKREAAEMELLESLWEKVEEIASLAGPAEVPIKLGVAGAFASFAALGAGYAAAGEELKRKEASMGFAEGLVMGVMRELPENVRDYFWREEPTPNPAFEAGAKISQYYFNGGLALGYAHGRDVQVRGLSGPFWTDLRTHMTRQFGDPAAENWGRQEWIDFYIAAATAFYKGHISD